MSLIPTLCGADSGAKPMYEPSAPGHQTAHSDRPEVSVVLPTLNERENIVLLLEDLRSRLRDGNYSYELLVIDDGSVDGTVEAVICVCHDDPGLHLIKRSDKPGLAYSIREGIERSTGAVVLVMDADFNHQPADALRLFEVARHVDLAIGSRFIFGGGMPSLGHYHLSYLFNLFLRVTLRTRMDENLSGFFAIKRERLFELDFDKIFWGYGDYFFRLLLLSQRLKFLHVELPVFYGLRHSGERKTRFLRIFRNYLREALHLWFLKALRRW